MSPSCPFVMDPSPDVASTFVDVNSNVTWCEMDEATTNSLFKHLGLRREMHPRVLAAMPQESLTAHISSWRLENDALPSPAQVSQEGLLGHAARAVSSSVSPKSTTLLLVQKRCASKNLNLDWRGGRRQTR